MLFDNFTCMCAFDNNLSLLPCLGTAANFVELEREEITFDSSHYEACVTLNASSAITQTTLVVLTLTVPDEEGAIALSIGTANVTISPSKEPGYESKYITKSKKIFFKR